MDCAGLLGWRFVYWLLGAVIMDMTGMIPAPIRYEVTLKPTGMSRKVMRMCPEFVVDLTATSREQATQQARRDAEASGFTNYAITKVREIKQ